MTLKNKISISLIVVLLLSVFLFVFSIRPVYNEIKNNSQELIYQKQKLNSLEDKIKNIEEFRKNYQEIKQNLEKAKTLFITSESPVGFIRFLEQIAQEHQAYMIISPSAPVKESNDPWLSINFQIASVSSFPNFLKFFEKLESSSYLIEIKNLSIVRLSEKNLTSKELEGFSPGDVRATLSLKVYAN